jgi:hypothetical protein
MQNDPLKLVLLASETYEEHATRKDTARPKLEACLTPARR